jgi:hypothetical protein
VNLWEALQLSALRDVWFDRNSKAGLDPEYRFRKIFRWYSETFSTPLHLVDTLPLEDVVRAWCENEYEEMTDEELERTVKELAISPAKLREIERDEDIKEALDFDDVGAIRAANANMAPPDTKKLEEAVAPALNALDNLLRQVRESGRETELPAAKPALSGSLPPGIHMKFVSEEELEAEIEKADSLALFEPPKRRK